MSNSMWTAKRIERSMFRIVCFGDGLNGSAMQEAECTEEPRLTYIWRRTSREDVGARAVYVDGKPVADLDDAARRLNAPRGTAEDSRT